MAHSLFDLTGKVAIVTGGNGGIGFGMARGLALAGATVVIAGRNNEKSAQAAREIEALGAAAIPLAVDVTDAISVDQMVGTTVRELGRLDILVNNAGINIRKSTADVSLDEWHTVIETNLTSAFLCAKAAYPTMKAAGSGKIINIGSVLSVFATATAPAYSASKGAVVQFTKSIALSWAQDNIQANAILPGWIETDLTRDACQQLPHLNAAVLSRTAARRWGHIDDLAGTAVYLSSGASDFVTGAVILVDGGFSVQG